MADKTGDTEPQIQSKETIPSITPLGISKSILDYQVRESFYLPRVDSKGGWVGHFIPSGVEVPQLPENQVVPYDFYTEEEKELMRDAKKSNEKQLKFWNWDFYVRNWEIFRHWIHEAFFDWYAYSPICFGRSWDFKDDKLNLANKLYIQERGNVTTKTRIFNCYERAQYAVLQSLIFKRAYMNHDDFRYVYKSSFLNLENQLVFSNEDMLKLRAIFLKYDPDFRGYVSYENMCKVLKEFGIKASESARKTEFRKYVNPINIEEACWGNNIEFEQFLMVAHKLERDRQKLDWHHNWESQEDKVPNFERRNTVYGPVRERAKSSLRNNPHYAGPSSLSKKISLGLF